MPFRVVIKYFSYLDPPELTPSIDNRKLSTSPLHMISPQTPAFFQGEDLDLRLFIEICSQQPDSGVYANSSNNEQRIIVYDGDGIRSKLSHPSTRKRIASEWCHVLRDGPGILMIRNAFESITTIDRSTFLFSEIVEKERRSDHGQGDHFGDNERIWNAIQKVCERDPELFIEYYGNPILALACESWLGPAYRVTAQMNNVRPGSAEQSVHRDYHLGFQSPETIERYPAHAQVMSQYLTLQGAVAHSDMPVESGPTCLLPYSHHFAPGYQTYRHPDFQAFFAEHRSQVEMQKGDMIFFSPAVYHAAGANRTNSDRIANLLQISSAFGRTMETLDTDAMLLHIYPHLLRQINTGDLTIDQARHCVAASADGYAFPTNMDLDPPVNGNAPETRQEMAMRALEKKCPLDEVQEQLADYALRRGA